MAQSGYTPIKLYYSTTATSVPVNTNLANGELAINITDGKLYYKDNAGVVKLLASNAITTPVLSFQTSLGGLTPSTATTGVVTLAGTLNTSSGGTGLTTYTAGDLLFYAAGTLLSKLAIGTNGYVITSSGTAPQYTAPSSLSVGTATNIAGGAAGSVPYNTAAATTSFLAIGSANQVLAVNTGATAPQYVSQSTLSVGTATNIAGGVAGSVPYNTGAGATSFLSIGTAGQVLIVNSGATAPQYTAQSSLSVGTATNIAGGTANQIPYQTGAGATSFVTAPTVSSTYLQWNGTSFVWAAASGGGGTTTNALTIGTGLSGTSFNGSAAVTIAIDSTVVTLTGTQTLTNKTLTSPTIGTILNTGTLTLPTSTDTLVGRATTDTLTNKRIDPRVVATTTAATLTPSIATADVYAYTALAANLTINIPSGTPVDGDKLMFRFLDNGTSRNLTWNITSTGYTAIGVTLPTATTANKTTYVGCIYNANNTRWDVIAVTTQA